MTGGLILYGSSFSGNCMKPKWVADYLGIAYTWKEVDLLKKETQGSAFLEINAFGQVPVAKWADGRVLTQSNAIMLYLAEERKSALIPSEPFARAEMMSWLFWEQYSHEPAIAVRRWQSKFLQIPECEIDESLYEKGYRALKRMEDILKSADWFVQNTLTLSDIALVAYTRVADEGGFDLSPYPRVRDWIARVEGALNINSEKSGS